MDKYYTYSLCTDKWELTLTEITTGEVHTIPNVNGSDTWDILINWANHQNQTTHIWDDQENNWHTDILFYIGAIP